MNILQQMIGCMNKEEQRHFKLFANRTNAATDRKDLQLFDYIRHSFPDYDEDKAQIKLYGKGDKNTLYRLKNRLLDDVSRSQALQYFGNNDYNLLLNYLALARLFQARNQSEIAFHFLTRAEKRASELELFELLDLIYNELIRLSQETLEINPQAYIPKRKANRQKLNLLQEIDDILADIVYKIKTSQNFSGHDNFQLDELQKKIHHFTKDKAFGNSIQLRFKVYQSISRIMLQKQDFHSLEKYLLRTFAEFEKQQLFNKGNHEVKLQMLTYLVNSLFKNEKSALSLKYTVKLKEAMQEFNGILQEKYLFYYYNSLVINYSRTDLGRAIEILQEAKENPVIRKLPSYIVFIYGNLATLNFDNRNFKQAISNLVKLCMEPGFKNLDVGLRFKVHVAELIIRYELADFDFVEHKLEQLRKDFSAELNKKEYGRQLRLMEIISAMTRSNSVKQDKKLILQINKLIDGRNSNEEAQNDLLNYNEWLKTKLTL
jgi:AraC-like DNA-binding protein